MGAVDIDRADVRARRFERSSSRLPGVARGRRLGTQHERAGGRIALEETARHGHAEMSIQHDRTRRWAVVRIEAHVQARIVDEHGADADEDALVQSTKTMRHDHAVRTTEPQGRLAGPGNLAVARLRKRKGDPYAALVPAWLVRRQQRLHGGWREAPWWALDADHVVCGAACASHEPQPCECGQCGAARPAADGAG